MWWYNNKKLVVGKLNGDISLNGDGPKSENLKWWYNNFPIKKQLCYCTSCFLYCTCTTHSKQGTRTSTWYSDRSSESGRAQYLYKSRQRYSSHRYSYRYVLLVCLVPGTHRSSLRRVLSRVHITLGTSTGTRTLVGTTAIYRYGRSDHRKKKGRDLTTVQLQLRHCRE